MTFMRTPGGLNSQRKFHRVELTFHIEGKNMKATPDFKVTELCDYLYYKSLLEHFLPGKKIKIKVLGCCNDVLEYNAVIEREKLKNNFSIVDRDFNGLLKSRINDKGIIYTYGYSWENDFWSKTLCCYIVGMLSAGSSKSIEKFCTSLKRGIRRISILNKINIAFKSQDLVLFKIAKKGGKRGIALNFHSSFILLKSEFSRLTANAKISAHKSNAAEIFREINCEECRLIQGHFFEYLVCNLIVTSTKSHSRVNGDIDFEAIKNIGLHVFSDNPKLWLERKVYDHYNDILSEIN